MDGYITFSQLGLLVIFLVVTAVGGYAIATMRKINAAVTDLAGIIKEHRESLNQTIPFIAQASENVAAITTDLRSGFNETSKAMATADQIASYAVVLGEVAKSLAGLFSSAHKH
jgi:hypothetical protein